MHEWLHQSIVFSNENGKMKNVADDLWIINKMNSYCQQQVENVVRGYSWNLLTKPELNAVKPACMNAGYWWARNIQYLATRGISFFEKIGMKHVTIDVVTDMSSEQPPWPMQLSIQNRFDPLCFPSYDWIRITLHRMSDEHNKNKHSAHTQCVNSQHISSTAHALLLTKTAEKKEFNKLFVRNGVTRRHATPVAGRIIRTSER